MSITSSEYFFKKIAYCSSSQMTYFFKSFPRYILQLVSTPITSVFASNFFVICLFVLISLFNIKYFPQLPHDLCPHLTMKH